MLKQTLFLILLFLTTVQVASARSFIRSHEDFVHTSEFEQDQLIIKTMELAVELEARYEKDLETYGFNQHRYDRYVEALSKLSRLFIAGAVADTSKDWTTVGKDFIALLKRPDSRCIFAGWVSTAVKDKSGKTVCTHPGKTSNKNSPEAKAYPDSKSADCKSGNPNKIQCSPVIFGYKKESDHSLFCVDATKGAHNSSYNCMQEALATGSTQKGDSKETRLKNLRERLVKNPEVFSGVQEFIYKTCVCDETDPSVNFNKEYHEYMRPHRTCYGLMEMMGDTIICEEPKLLMDVSIFKALRDFSKNKVVKGKDADELYTNFIKTEVVKAAPDEYKRLCGAGLPVQAGKSNNVVDENIPKVVVPGEKPMDCTGTCKPSSSKETPWICSFEVKNPKGGPYTLDSTPKEQPKSADDTSIEITASIEKKQRKLKCDLTIEKPKDDGPKPTLSIKIKSKTSTEVVITAETKDQGEWQIVWKTHSPSKPKDKKEKRSGIKITETTPPVDPDKPDEAPEKPEKPEKKPEPQDEGNVTEDANNEKEITKPRQGEKYKVCAELRKDSEKIEAPSCVDVEPLDKADTKPTSAPKPSSGTGMPMQQQMPMQMRGTSDASALGIK